MCFPVKFPKIFRQLFYCTPPDSCSYMLISLKKYLFVCKIKEIASRFFLTLSLLEKLKISIFEMPIITQTLNINNLRATSAKSINLHTIRNLLNILLKMLQQRQCLLLPLSRYCCSKVGRYCHPSSGVQGAKRLMLWTIYFYTFKL